MNASARLILTSLKLQYFCSQSSPRIICLKLCLTLFHMLNRVLPLQLRSVLVDNVLYTTNTFKIHAVCFVTFSKCALIVLTRLKMPRNLTMF